MADPATDEAVIETALGDVVGARTLLILMVDGLEYDAPSVPENTGNALANGDYAVVAVPLVCLILYTSLVYYELDPNRVLDTVDEFKKDKDVSAVSVFAAYVKFKDNVTDVTGIHDLKS